MSATRLRLVVNVYLEINYMDIEWKHIDYADKYEVSNMGDLRNIVTGRIKAKQVDRYG